MASLHRDPRGRSPYWYCAYTLADGRRCFKSTKQRERKKAQEVCRGWEKAVEAAGRGDLTQIQARKILDEILESVSEGPIRQKSIREFFSNWLAGKQLSKAKSTGDHYKKGINEFLSSLGQRAEKS